jgi:TolB-like protein/DNA-binding SARP family transcriptional activator/Flp pilus assembly protein TadD
VFTLETFGGLSLRGADGPITTRAGQRRRLALLAVLAAERRPVSRDKLVGYFWPESDAERARHLLADSLYVLRSGSHEDVIQTFGDDVSLNEACVRSDVGMFLEAIDAGENERAASAYAGPFLDGIFISDAPEFERWAESTRSRLENERRRCLERLATEAGERGDHSAAVRWWRDLAAADRLSSRAAVGLIRALSLAGDRAAALQFARVHEGIVRSELDSAPDPAVAALEAELRLRDEGYTPVSAAAAEHTSSDSQAPTITLPSPDQPARGESARRLTTLVPTRALWLTVAGIVAAAIVVAVLRARNTTQPTAQPTSTSAAPLLADSAPSIAVLPFEAISSDREADFVAAGITDELTTLLDRFQRIRVVSRTSAVAAKRPGVSTPAIGQMLHARYLVEGSVRLAGGQMRVAPRLIDAADGTAHWSQEYTRDFSPRSIVAIEQAIAESIAVKLNVRLGAGGASRLVSRPPANVQAFEAYIRGALLLKSRNPDGARKAIDYFQQVLAQDSTYAPAYAGLADAYAVFGIGNIGDFNPNDYFPRARDAAMRALAFDSTLAEAHAALGYFELLYNLDWAKAEAELGRAVTLQPSYPSARIYRTVLCEWTGRFADAVREAQVARELDLLSPVTNIELGRALFFAGRNREAEAELRHTLDLDSTSLRTHLHLGQVLARERRYREAIAELTIATQLSTSSSRPLALLAHANALAGNRGEALRILDSLRARRRQRYVPAFDLAIVYAGLGNAPETMRWLDESVSEHSIRPYLLDPTFDPVRSDRRFHALLKRLGLPSTPPG